MTWADIDPTAVLLRTLVYVSAVGTAGSVFYAATGGARVAAGHHALRWQVLIGVTIIILIEPLRYLQFQTQISGGDFALAISPDMRWIGMETPMGQAAVVRLAAALGLLLTGLRVPVIAVPIAMVLIGSFVLEGHTASHDLRGLLAALLVLHLSIMAWWLAALLPLHAVARRATDHELQETVGRFGRQALLAVPTLFVAGVVLLGFLVSWHLDPFAPYQQAFALKLGLVTLVLGLAAVNKLCWSPLILTEPSAARPGLQRTIRMECSAAALVLAATAMVVSLSPQ